MPQDDNSVLKLFGAAFLAFVAMAAFVIWMPQPKPEPTPVKSSVPVPTYVAWTDEVITEATHGDVVRGMVLARRCEKCHGEEGFSDTGEVPNLASMDKLAFWKQMEDFRTGKRRSPIMQPVASVLTRRDESDLDAYFAMLPAIPDPQDSRAKQPPLLHSETWIIASRLITLGDGARGIPPCQACHGPVGNVRGAPSLSTQNADYILDQLDSFADGTRANDINLPMRTISHQMTEQDRKAVSLYYGSGLGLLPGAASPRWAKK